MNRESMQKWLPLGVVIMFVLLLGAVAILTAQGPSPIYACVNPAGQIRIVSDPAECKSQETNLNWNDVGLQGPAGPVGPVGISGYEIITNVIPIPTNSTNQFYANCSPGKKVLGGGVNVLGNSEATIFGSSPNGDSSWLGEVYNINRDATMQVFAICANIDS